MAYKEISPIIVAEGGTGRTTLTNHGVLIGAATSGITQLGVATNGQLLVGATAADPSFVTPTAGSGLAVTTNSTTLSYAISAPVSIANGGTNATSMTTTDGTVYFDGTRLVTTATGTSGWVLTSAGAGVAPAYAVLPASSITLTGDTGGGLTGNSFTFNGLTNAGKSVSFSGSGTTLSLNTTDAGNNTLIGKGTGAASLSGGQQHTALGLNALHSFTSGQYNVAIGADALFSQVTGDQNTAIGTTALFTANGAASNCAMGMQAGYNITTGSHNILIGENSGLNYTSSEDSNILLGYDVRGTAAESHVLRIGKATGSSNGNLNKAFICGIDGTNVGSVAKILTMASDQIGTATITAGTNISVVAGANTITINATGPDAFTWSVITANQTAAVFNGYFCNKAGTLALALPAASAVGDVIEVTNENTALGVQFTQAAGQQILIGNTNTTSGATGTLTSSAVGDTLKLVCKTANTVWRVTSMIGNWTVV